MMAEVKTSDLAMTPGQHAATLGSICPACGGDEVEGGFVDIVGLHAFQKVACSDEACGATWTESYQASGYSGLDLGGRSCEVPRDTESEAVAAFRPGVYRHYKGEEYLALGIARCDETDLATVIYTRLYAREGLPMSTRLLGIWNQRVDSVTGLAVQSGGVPRFEYVGQATG